MNYTTQPLQHDEQGVEAPVVLNTSFKIKEHSASLRIWGAGNPGMIVTVIHETRDDAAISDFMGGAGTEEIGVADQEAITILARYEGHIAACGICEVSLRQAERLGIFLVPCVEQGLMLRQEREEDRVTLGLSSLFVKSSLVRDFEVAEVAR